ncbi:histidine kinase [Curtobacterium sp. MCLR17_036]|uniref:sensor histidine kinase n=1 Tax=Curtobacterium sp. MCLR17_036 TaxID=2175620 RepID=UPI0021AC4240|nr:histidine kinase [Curtobacterium sp. MCLR17_036]WIE64275.1 histidine kinase [Curtobacterium sp. MCLR17_036]
MTTTATLPAVPVGRRIWAETWRLAVAALAGVIAFALVWSSLDTAGWSDARVGGLLVADLLCGVLALLLVPFRHRAPLPVTIVVVALSTVSTLGIGAAALAVVSIATRRRVVEIAVTSAVMVVATIVYEGVLVPDDATPLWQVVAAAAVVVALLAAIGIGIGQRRALVVSLRERAALLERDQQLREDRAREQERAHIAREMHDVLGHRLSLVALHAGALEYRGPALSPDETAAAAGVVRAEAHAALTDLRDVLGVLRDPASTGGDEVTGTAPPQPTLCDLPALLDQARAAGTTVRATLGDLDPVPPVVGRHAYRIVQEALTNARRHAPGRPVDVVLDLLPTPALRVVVTNPVASTDDAADAGAIDVGHGLRGLAERARLVGGTFRAGVGAEGVWTVEAVLPWTA